MILNYLKKYQQLITDNKLILEDERNTVKEKIKKIEETISDLKEKSEAALEGFSPRALERNYESEIKKCRNIIIQLEEQSSQLEEKIKNVEDEIKHLLEDIEYVKQNEREKNEELNNSEQTIHDEKTDSNEEKMNDDFPCNQSTLLNDNEIAQSISVLYNKLQQELKSIVYKVELCFCFMDIDSERSKLELKAIKRSIENVLNILEKNELSSISSKENS